MEGFYLGLDVGTVSIKAVAISNGAGPRLIGNLEQSPWQSCSAGNAAEQQLHVYLSPYRRVLGNPLDATEQLLDELIGSLPEGSVSGIGFTGSGARLAAQRFGTRHYSEFKALATGVGSLYPQVDAILEMGGENSKYIEVAASGEHKVGILDYGTNGDCAAGTGSFLDQQASRLCYEVEEIGDIVATTERGAKIAGRCSVFAKSDMIHAQQKGSTPPMVLKGLCEAVARNFKGNVAKGRELKGTTAFVGGVAQNQGVFSALRSVFGVENGKFFVPEAPAYYAALGAALLESKALPCALNCSPDTRIVAAEFASWPALSLERVRYLTPNSSVNVAECDPHLPKQRCNAFLGIDIGSVSTNLVLMSEEGLVIHEVYLRTKARPVEVVKQGLAEIEQLYGDKVRICGAGTTGSGRELIGELVAADCINDEITAHKTGACHVADLYLDQPVDTILEIGGQDAKFIRLDQGVVVDFTMNEACAAGTGSFLEEQAEKLGVNIIDEFAALALASPSPLRLGERCTVYMEMDITASLRKGAAKSDVIAGLAYSVAQNYLNRVVRGRPIGESIFFQGGTAYNHAVAAAFADILDKQVIVPPHNGVMGAYGMALLAREKLTATGERSNFRGFALDQISTSIREFTCKACSNHCDIKEFTIDGVRTYWGDKCSDRYRRQVRVERQPVIADLVALRSEALETDWLEHFRSGAAGNDLQRLTEQAERCGTRKHGVTRPSFGLLRAMYFYQRYPFWRTYLEALGGKVCITETTTKQIADAGIEAAVAEFCFPIQVAHGHLVEIGKLNPDRVVLPAIINEPTDDLSIPSHVCPWGQALSATLRHSPAAEGLEAKLLEPLVHFREGEGFVERQLWKVFREWGAHRRHHRLAVKLAYAAQAAFQNRLLDLGKTALEQLSASGENGLVLVGRPYNAFDPGMNLNLASKLRKQYGANVIPLDCLPCGDEPLDELNPNMYWNYGRKILQVALWTSRHPNLHLIYLTNFMCGPDSYVKTFAGDGAGKPFLTLQFDGHGNDAGMMTRCEAYLDSKGLLQWWKKPHSH